MNPATASTTPVVRDSSTDGFADPVRVRQKTGTGVLAMREAALRHVLAPVEVALAALAVLGSAVFVPTVTFGRTALFWPSAHWAATFAGTLLATSALWWLAVRAARGRGWRRWHAAAWPFLALLPPAFAAGAFYVDDRANHLSALYAPTRQSLLAYGLALLLAGQIAYWTSLLAGRGAFAATARRAVAPVAIGVAAAGYLNASVFLQWLPRQTDLRVNLDGARDLLAGTLPYRDEIPVWADRVHLLPATLVLLFGPLAMLPDAAARVVFFLGNQLLWLAAMGLLIRRLVPAGQRPAWHAGALALGAVYWPWQEAIRFGQQDGLLMLLFVLSITAIAAGREGAAGVALGLALVVKPLSVWLPLAYLLHGKWRALVVATLCAAALTLATLPFTGWAPWWHFLRVELPDMLPGTVRGTNIPLASVHARFFVGREALGNGDPAPTLAVISALNAAASLVALLVVCRMRLHPDPDTRRAWLLDAAMGLTLTLLLAPMAWQHYASWLCIAFLVLALPAIWQPLGRLERAALAGLSGAGFFLLSLNDDQLLHLVTPVVARWPAAISFYALGLLCVAGALAVARFATSPATEKAP